MSKNGVNTCPPISEFKIINAPKFSPNNDDLFTIISFWQQLITKSSLNLDLHQIPRISQPPEPDLMETRSSATIC